MRILTAEAMQQIDRMAIEEIGIPGLVLMENAAIAVADAIGDRFSSVDSAAVFCGSGNNGGDGLAVGRQLSTRGFRVALFLVTGGGTFSGDAARQLDICKRLGLTVREVDAETDLEALFDTAGSMELVVDSLFGTGLTRKLSGLFERLVEVINRQPHPIVAVDLPSGLSGSSSEILGPHIDADLTVTFGAPKIP